MRQADFRDLAPTAGIRADDADEAFDGMLPCLGQTIDRVKSPDGIAFSGEVCRMVDTMLGIGGERIKKMALDKSQGST